MGQLDPVRAREFQHFQLFRRMARDYYAGNPILRSLLRDGDFGDYFRPPPTNFVYQELVTNTYMMSWHGTNQQRTE
jgi:hypothetical protein